MKGGGRLKLFSGFALLLPMLSGWGGGVQAAEAASFACPLPPEAMPATVSLPHVAAAVTAGRPLRLLAIGGASTAGTGMTSATLAFPQRVAEKLRAQLPGVPVSVVNRGRPGETTAEMVKRLAVEIQAEHPTLVLWEVGTVEAVGGGEPQQLAEDVGQGLDLLRRAQADVILIDMQYSPAATVVDFGPYLDSLHNAADMAGVPLFDRFAAMRAWDETGLFDFDAIAPRDAEPVAERVQDCVASGLAEMVRRATTKTSPTAATP